MAYQIDPFLFTRFRGIREYNGVNAGGEISAIKSSNVELVQADTGNAVAIRSMQGNASLYALPDGYNIVDIYESEQGGKDYTFIYAENDIQGELFWVEPIYKTVEIYDSEIINFELTGKSNGLTMTSTAYDVFVITNGKQAYSVCVNPDDVYGDSAKPINAEDEQGRKLEFLAMTEWNGFLVVGTQYGVSASHQNDIYTWNDINKGLADSWFIDFSKKVTAVVSFTNGLYIFTKEDLSFIPTTPNDTDNSYMKTASMNGCFDYKSVVKHDTYMFFYDNNQKNVYYIQLTDTGQTRPTGPVAKEIQSYFNKVQSLKMYSCIYNTRNEIWCLVNDNILIFDYNQQEWTTRQGYNINSIAQIGNTVYSAGGNKVYVENMNHNFDGKTMKCVYQTTYFNSGSNSNLKKQKTPLLLVLNDNFVNDFYVQLTVDYKEKSPKPVKLASSSSGIFAPEDTSELVIVPETMKFGTARFSAENTYSKKVVEISTPQTWYTMSVKIYTEEENQGFYITSMELKNIKVKTKTKGR